MSLTGNNAIVGSGYPGNQPFSIEQSLRFNNTNESVYLERTPSADGNKQVATLSFWIKNCGVSDSGATDNTRIMYAGNSTSDASYWQIMHTSAKFNINNYRSGPGNGNWTTDAQYRDPGAWYHYVVSYNQGTVNTYVNGELQSQSVTIGGWSGAVDTAFNSNGVLMVVGPKTTTASVKSIYLAEYHWIDGQALDPSYFGETDSSTNQWVPKFYVGTYGTNGFYLNFSDSASLGADSSGNGNNFTPTNLAATDQVLDSPTNNFCTFNPLGISTYNKWNTASEGNLKLYGTGDNFGESTFHLSSGKWYFEVDLINSYGKDGTYITLAGPNDTYLSGSFEVILLNGVGTGSNPGLYGVAVDMDTGSWSTTRNGSAFGSGSFTPQDCKIGICNGNGAFAEEIVLNFGQDSSFAGNRTAQNNTDDNGIGDFYYTPPSGYLALCTENLPDPSIALPGDYFNTVLYTGDGTSDRDITGVGFQPDFVWHKSRSDTRDHRLLDAVRGATLGLSSNLTSAEYTESTGLTSFDSDGFSIGNAAAFNTNTETYVAWNWKADNTSGSSNTDGTITSTVSANTTAGFSIVSYTGNGTAGATVGHGLSKAPEIYILKKRDVSGNSWLTYANYLGYTKYLALNNSSAAGTDSNFFYADPTSSVFSLGFYGDTNGNGNAYIGYCFHSVEGYSKIGSYTGNGSADGAFVYTGFRPAFVLVKRTDSTGNWIIMDGERSPYNIVNKYLFSDLSNVEDTADRGDFVSNGFKIRTTSTAMNTNAATYIYMAFAENPFKYSNAR